jgi:hypothetical protein
VNSHPHYHPIISKSGLLLIAILGGLAIGLQLLHV